MTSFDKLRMTVCLGAAAGIFAVALSPLLDSLADRSFAWHMVQHMLLLFVVPFFALLAAPFRLVNELAPKRFVASVVRLSRVFEVLARPPVALAIFLGVLWATHFSGMYEFSLDNEWAHVLEHALYFGAGLLFWSPVLAPPPLRPFSFPVRILYLLVALPQGALLAFALAGSGHVLYSHYSAYPDAFADQSNAAAVMWIGGGLILFSAFLGTFGAWALRESAASSDPIRGGTV